MLDRNLQPIRIPAYRSLKVSDNGEIIIEPLGSDLNTKQIVGQLGITLAAGVELKKFPDGEIRVRDGSLPQFDNEVAVVPGHIELSNVNITDELVNSIEDQRQYEVNIKLMSSAGELDESGATLMRLPS